MRIKRLRFTCKVYVTDVLPDGPTALGHPTNEDLFAGTPVRAAIPWRVYRSWQDRAVWALPLVGIFDQRMDYRLFKKLLRSTKDEKM